MIKKESSLKDEKLHQHWQNLNGVIKAKQLFLKQNLSLIDLSNKASIPVDQVKKVLKEKLKLTFFEFISEYKISKAKQLLINISKDQFSLSAIADQSGFNTTDSFVTIFKQYTNMSPDKYRITYYRNKPESNISF